MAATTSEDGGSALERHLRAHGLESCFPFFPPDMPLKAFAQLTDDLMRDKYGIKCPTTRVSLLRLKQHRCNSSSGSDCRLIAVTNRASSTSPSTAGSSSPPALLSATGGGSGGPSVGATATAILRPLSPIKRGRLPRADESPSPPSGPSSVIPRRLLQRTVSEDVRHRKKRPLSVSLSHSQHQLLFGGNLGAVGHHLSASCASSIGGYASETSNLLRLRNSVLGHSEPNLSSSIRELSLSRKSSAGGRVTPVKKIVGITASQRCLSPQGLLSPTDSSKVHSPFHPSLFSFASNAKKQDHRRWSLASLASSSGYGPSPNGTECSESPASSHERLHHTSSGPPAVDCPGVSPSSAASGECAAASGSPLLMQQHQRKGSCGCDDASGGAVPSEGKEPMGGSGVDAAGLAPSRPRSRSLSGPVKLSETFMLNSLYRERFPKAVQQMEENLKLFIEENGGSAGSAAEGDIAAGGMPAAVDPSSDSVVDSDGTLRFAFRQVVALARDCLEQSREQLLSTSYFQGLDENLEKLVLGAKAGSLCSAEIVRRLTRRLQVVTCRTARLLECLEFDPDEFYCLLEQTEGEAKKRICAADVPQYVVGKLGLNRAGPDATDVDLLLSSASEGERSDHEDQIDVKQHFRAKPPTEDDFINIKLISNGAYGAVHLVKHKETRQRFAMKQILKSNLVLRNQVEQVFTERDILAFVDNPFVVSLYCTFETRTHLCLVLEYVEGGDCAALLKNMGPLPVDMARLYFAETVLALEYLHSYGIVHRDLKPDNLLITNFGHIKLTDFGLSKMGIMNLATNLYEGMLDKESKQFNDRQIFGTPEYIAPEVILRQGYGKPVDWWSMGIILYEFLVGCVPFFGDTPEELFSHVLTEGIEWPEEKEFCPPDDAQDLIFGLLQRDPLDRLGTGGAQEVKEHAFFEDLDWNGLLRQKAEFMPTLEGEDDTSYFDSRADRYRHDAEDYSNDDEDDVLFHSFTSCSPRYSRVYELFEENRERFKDDGGGGRRQNSATSTPSSLERRCSGGGSGSDLSGSAGSSPRSLPPARPSAAGPPVSRSDGQPAADAVSAAAVGAPETTSATGLLHGEGFRAVEPCSAIKPSGDAGLLDAKASAACPDENWLIEASDGRSRSSCGGTALSAPREEAAPPLMLTSERGDEAIGPSAARCHSSFGIVAKPSPVAASAAEPGALGGILMPCQQPAEAECRPGNVGYTDADKEQCRAVSSGRGGGGPSQGSSSSSSGAAALDSGGDEERSLSPGGASSSLSEGIADVDRRAVSPAAAPTPAAEPPAKAANDIAAGSGHRTRHDLVARQLSLVIPTHEDFVGPPASPVSSFGSRESSPTRDYIFSSLAKIPILIKKGPRGYGFTLRAIRVFLGDGEKSLYTLHHLIVAVDKNGPAWEAGMRPGFIITHVNNEPVEGLNHTQVVAHILSKSSKVLVRALPIEETSIKTTTGSRTWSMPSAAAAKAARLARKGSASAGGGRGGAEKGAATAAGGSAATPRRQRHRSSSSLFKKLSKRNAEQSLVQTSWSAAAPAGHAASPPYVGVVAAAAATGPSSGRSAPASPRSQPAQQQQQLLLQGSFGADQAVGGGSGGCAPSPPTSVLAAGRPSTLTDLKGKLQSPIKSPNRRKSIHNIPLSPLARTPSSSPLALSPTSAAQSLASPASSAGGGSSSGVSGGGSGSGSAGRVATAAPPHYHLMYRHSSPSQVTRPATVSQKHRSLAETVAPPSVGVHEQQPSPDLQGHAAPAAASGQESAGGGQLQLATEEDSGGGSHDKQWIRRTGRWQERKNLGDSF